MVPEEVILEVFSITKPPDFQLAQTYLEILREVLNTPQDERYWMFFLRRKREPKVGVRRIVSTHSKLGFIDQVLFDSFRTRFPKSDDYLQEGGGIIAAAQAHLNPQFGCGLTIDLKSAFDWVTEDKIKYHLGIYFPKASKAALEVLANLLTYEGSAPQGRGMTLCMYNLVMGPIDIEIRSLKKWQKKHILTITRYVDDYGFSCTEGTDLQELRSKVEQIVTGGGFVVGKVEFFNQVPLRYLGMRIFPNRLEVENPKRFAERILLVANSPGTLNSRRTIAGIRAWLRQVYKGKFPPEIQEALSRYEKSIKQMERLF